MSGVVTPRNPIRQEITMLKQISMIFVFSLPMFSLTPVPLVGTLGLMGAAAATTAAITAPPAAAPGIVASAKASWASIKTCATAFWDVLCTSGNTAWAIGAGTKDLAYSTGAGVKGVLTATGNGIHAVSSTVSSYAVAYPAMTGVAGVALTAATVYVLYKAIKFGASPKVAAYFALRDGEARTQTQISFTSGTPVRRGGGQ